MMKVAIVGATGNVGRKILKVVENKKFPISELFLIFFFQHFLLLLLLLYS
jgi:aspartate-semialdehyde dehydrogenase